MKLKEAQEWAYLKLKAGLKLEHTYHNLEHTKYVTKMANKIATLEGCSQKERELLSTACVYHDIGFLELYPKNEYIGARIAGEILPSFEYNECDIGIIKDLILATRIPQQANTLLEEIICDADLYYLGTDLNYNHSNNLRKELEWQNMCMNDKEWLNFQIRFLEMHKYFTKYGYKNLREIKNQYLIALKKQLEEMN